MMRRAQGKNSAGEDGSAGAFIACRAIASALLALILLPAAAADILLGGAPVIGEPLNITIRPASPEHTLVIVAPSTTYRFLGGPAEEMIFIPQEAGEHTIHVLSANEIMDTAAFTVGNAAARDLPLAPPVVLPGEPIVINAPAGALRVSIMHDGQEFVANDARRPLTYLPPAAGAYRIRVEHANGTAQEASVVVKGEDPFLLEPVPASPGRFSVPRTEGKMRIETADGDLVNVGMVFRREGRVLRQAAAAHFDPGSIEQGAYDLELSFQGRTLRRMAIKGLSYDPSIWLGVEEIGPQSVSNPLPGAVDAFAIDPSALEFTSAEVEFVAVGTALYKCSLYNFANRTCVGQHAKVMDLVPGRTYTITIDAADPLFSQAGYLTNPGFDSGTTGWATLAESGTASYGWAASDAPQSGVAQVSLSGSNRNSVNSYYQAFTLSIPQGTALTQLAFSARWRISAYSRPGSIDLQVRDATRTVTYCSVSRAFSGTTSWALETLTAPGSCPIASFTPGNTYTILLRCTLATGPGGGSNEVCRWDDASVTATYNDTAAPSFMALGDSPDPVGYGMPINISVNVTDNIAVDRVLAEINGTNHTMARGGGDVYHLDTFSTARPAGTYAYRIFANDTSGNMNVSGTGSFAIVETAPPAITLLGPQDGAYTALAQGNFSYTVTDQSGVDNCTLLIDGEVANSTSGPPLGVASTMTAAIAEGAHLWSIACTDTAGNSQAAPARAITRDSTAPAVYLDVADDTLTGGAPFRFRYTVVDSAIESCTLWGNFSGSWSANQTNTTPVASGAASLTDAIALPHGTHAWNVHCADKAGNAAANGTNRTIRADAAAPVLSGEAFSVPSGSAYAPARAYSFNSSWSDSGSAVGSVLFEHNFSGTPENMTPVLSGGTYAVLVSDLAAGTYRIRWHANDSAGNANQTAPKEYIVEKAPAALNLTLNGAGADIAAGLGDTVNSTGILLSPPAGYIELYLDGSLAASGQGRVEHATQLLQERRYNFTLIHPETQNHTAARSTLFADVLDTTPPSVRLQGPANGSFHPAQVTFSFIPFDNIEVGNCTVILDGVPNASADASHGAEGSITIPGVAEGIHTWTVSCSDAGGNTALNDSPRRFIVDTLPPAAFGLHLPASGSISANLTPALAWNRTAEENFMNYTVLIDNDAGFGSVNYRASTAGINMTSALVSIGDQMVWYWKVIAYDLAGNSRESGQVFSYTADATGPAILQHAPADGAYLNTSSAVLAYSVSDSTAAANCSLILDGALNQTDESPVQGMNNFSLELSDGEYRWSVECYDGAHNRGSSSERALIVDSAAPSAFAPVSPADNILSADSAPVYVWEPSADASPINYTVEVSSDPAFSTIDHALSTTATAVQQDPALADGTWYWRVWAVDGAGNRRSAPASVYRVDTAAPSEFDLLSPANGTQARNASPVLRWQESVDGNLRNYTILISDTPSFSHVNLTIPSAVNASQVLLPANVPWHWSVVATDELGRSTDSRASFAYLADFVPPAITILSPANSTTITGNSLVDFRFVVDDTGSVESCSLHINGVLDKTISDPATGAAISISSTLPNGAHAWRISCTDSAQNEGSGEERTLNLNVIVPIQRLYESSPGTANYAAPRVINLSYANDGVENNIGFSIPGGAVVTAVNATMLLNGSGMLIPASTVNFSGTFSQSNNNVFYVTWKLIRRNSTGTAVICQAGDDGAGGTAIGNTQKKTLRGSCTVAQDHHLAGGDSLTLAVSLYSSSGSTRSFSHYWESASESYAQFSGYKLGTLAVAPASTADPRIPEGESFTESCIAACADGDCLQTDVSLEYHNGSSWAPVGAAGSVTLNGSQANPVSIGRLNGSVQVDFALRANAYSQGSLLRCAATSAYSNSTGAPKNVSVTDVTPPSVSLESPPPGAAYEPMPVTFAYTAGDARLANCSLWGNWSGWHRNQTGSPPSGQQAAFGPLPFGYGAYSWGVECVDLAGNSAASPNATFIIAGDVEIAGIAFHPASPVEGEPVVVAANVTNRANKSELVSVAFWDGPPGTGEQIGQNVTVALAPGGWSVANANYTARIGTREIHAVADPPEGSGSIVESDESNNAASRTLSVSAWQVFYGNATGNYTLGGTFSSWLIQNESGNIYISDSDTLNGISFLFLRPLGRNTTGSRGGSTDDDFGELDAALSTSQYGDSINRTFTSGGDPVMQEAFTVFGSILPAVPVAGSAPGSSFTTGILWDADDSANAHYDQADREDVVFVTKISPGSPGAYGTYDYEIRVPAQLKEYRGTTGTVTFYYEIQ